MDEAIRQAAIDALERVREKIIANIDAAGLKASGRTQASMEVQPYDTGVRLVGRPYFQGLEIGRPAGRTPRNFDEIIKQWIIDKGLQVTPIPYKTDRQHKYTVEERSLQSMAGAIAHNIRLRGFEPWRNGGRAPSPQRDVYTPVIEEEVPTITDQLASIIANIIVNEYSPNTGLRK